MIILQRIREPRLARFVAREVALYNHTACRWQDVIRYPHYAIRMDNKLAGWIGYRASAKNIYELIHMTILPKYRRHGLAKESVQEVLDALAALGGKWVWVRISRDNRASICLARDLGFHMPRSKDSVRVLGRKLVTRSNPTIPPTATETELGEE